MQIIWRRGKQELTYNRPVTDFTLGVRGSGKSSLLETRAEGFLRKGHCVLDLFGSKDGEGLAWLRSPWAKEKKICLIHGDSSDVEAPCDTVNVSRFRLSDFNKYDLLISSSPLYASVGEEFLQVNKITEQLYKRMSWSRYVYVIIREASNLYYSRLRINKNQTQAKAEMIYLIREARHMGVALGLDTLKFTSIDLDIRVVIDNIFLKAQGILGFPDDLSWLYGYFLPNFVRKMRPSDFVIVTKEGNVGVGMFPEIKWHKQERENIMKAVGIKIEHGEEMKPSKDHGDWVTVGDTEHVKMIEEYHYDKYSMNAIASELGRSPRTVRDHIVKHDAAVKRTGFCAVCRRGGGKAFNVRVHRSRHRNKKTLA